MCRINGFADPAASEGFIHSAVIEMRDRMKHGGPDDSGSSFSPHYHYASGHRRLSIMDLSPAGHQPMVNEDNNISLVYNGEIYNFLELRKELQFKGYTFSSGTDTEVILKAYQEWGESCFTKFNGMFTIAIEDKRRNLLYLVRDALGIKPLYYYLKNDCLIFASETRAFNAFPHLLKESSIWKILFLSFGRLPEPYSTYEDIFLLPNAHYLKYDLITKQSSISPYYHHQFSSRITNKKQAVELVRESLIQAVERQLISDAPLGVFLSGGIDSSLIALIAEKKIKDNLQTVSVIFNEEQYSEKMYQEILLKQLKNKHSYYTVTEADFHTSLPDIFQAMDQPTIDGVNTYFASRCAKEQGLKSVLSGLGADELFGGYPSFTRISQGETLMKVPGFVYNFCTPFLNYDMQKLAFLGIKDDLGLYLFLRGMYAPATTARILGISEREVNEVLKRFYMGNELKHLQSGNKASWLELNLYMKNQLLKDSDIMSMWHSLELRVPFLDKDLVENALSISPEVKFQGKPKELLIEAFRDILPEPIWNRSKKGFAFPFKKWLRNCKYTEDIVRNKNKEVQKIYHKFAQEKIHWTRLWSLVVINNWGKKEN